MEDQEVGEDGPVLFWHYPHEVLLDLHGVLTLGEAQPTRDAGTCVSTTTPSFAPKALPRTTLAVLRPTPGRATSSGIVRGTFPSCSSTRARAIPRKERALLR